MVAAQRILQIIPADGWVAVYDLGTADVEDLRTRPLVCWALVEDHTGTRVVGMDAETAAGRSPTGRFLGYTRTDEGLKAFRARGTREVL